jgi:protein-export membrane protein SecD
MKQSTKIRWRLAGIVFLAIASVFIAYPKIVSFAPFLENRLNTLEIALGLDLRGGVHLEYEADMNGISEEQRADALDAAQAVIERRVNAFGVGEPVVQTARSDDAYRIIVELPGVKDIEDAKSMIKETPTLEFREVRDENDSEVVETLSTLNEMKRGQAEELLKRVVSGEDFSELAKERSEDPGSRENGGDLDFVGRGMFVPEFEAVLFDESNPVGEVYPNLVESDFGWHIVKIEERRGEGDDREVRARHILLGKYTQAMFPDLAYKSTELTGKYLERASVEFPGGSYGLGEPQVVLQFDSEGAQIFKELTERNVGKPLAIFIDNEIETAPIIREAIPGGSAVITGDYTLTEAQELKSRLDEGALPVPLALFSQRSVDASLGSEDLQRSVIAGVAGLAAVLVYMIFYYRFFGLIAAVALILYAAMLISIFKLSAIPGWDWPITLTLSGIAGCILSIGMAVDANVLIFERIREELRLGKYYNAAIREGFRRAWPSIRDGNVSTILTALILAWMGTGFVKGFAIILAIGVLLSMFTAVVLVRTVLIAIPSEWVDRRRWLLFSSKAKSVDTSV